MAFERQHRPIDKEFEECDHTGVLDISGRNLRMFPNIGDDLYDPLEVFTAIISGNRFDKFPRPVLSYTNVVTLSFHNNALRNIPTDLIRLEQLRHLDLSRNFLQKLPSSLCDLPLEKLSLNNNRLRILPPELGKMSTLKSLDVSCNDLVDLPKSFTELHSLTFLNLRRNQIRELPKDIFKIPLWYLNVSSNSLTRLPVTLRHLVTLTEFYCSNNPLEVPPAQICVRGINHVFKYLGEMEKYGSDPQLFASNREESLMRRRRDQGKRATRPTSDASTISGDGSDYERSFLDEMSTIVQSAFGGGSKDGNFLGRNESEPGTSKHWTQLHSYDDNSPYRGNRAGGAGREFNKSSGRYRSQSPGPPAHTGTSLQTQHSTPTSTHFGTLPRSNKDSSGNLHLNSGRGLIDEPARSGSFHNYGGANRVSSPVDNKVLRTLSSENKPERAPSNPDLSSYHTTDERSYLAKKTELPVSPSIPHQYQNSATTHNIPPSTIPTTSSPKVTSDDEESKRPTSPANSRDGSVTPTPDDIDSDDTPATTPKKMAEELSVSNIINLLNKHDFNFDTNWDTLGRELGISLDIRQKVSSQAHLSGDYHSAMREIIEQWLTNDEYNSSWASLLNALEECGQSSIVSTLKKNYILLDGGFPVDVNVTPQHKSTAERQVSFSVAVSEIPISDRNSSVSSDTTEELELQHSISCPNPSSSVEREELEDELYEGDTPSPSPSPSQSPRKGPPPAPKPSKKKDIDTWPKKRAGGPHKRKGDVFKNIGKQDPNFTVRRMEVHMLEEMEKIQNVKEEVEEILGVTLSDDLGEDIADGVLLCQLINKLHPNTITNIHTAKRGETISGPKRTMNIAAFIAACKKVKVPEAFVCSAGDISEYKDPVRVCACIRGLLDTVSV